MSIDAERKGVDGKDRLLAKHSAVDGRGRFRQTPIDGVQFRPTRPVSHEDGSLAEIARTDWPEVDQPIVQVHVTTTEPGRIRPARRGGAASSASGRPSSSRLG